MDNATSTDKSIVLVAINVWTAEKIRWLSTYLEPPHRYGCLSIPEKGHVEVMILAKSCQPSVGTEVILGYTGGLWLPYTICAGQTKYVSAILGLPTGVSRLSISWLLYSTFLIWLSCQCNLKDFHLTYIYKLRARFSHV